MLDVPSATRANFPSRVRLFIRQRAAAEHADSIAAVSGLGRANRGCYAIDRALPGDGHECTVRVARERCEQPLGMTQGRRGGPALHAQPAFVDWKSLVACHLDAIAIADEIHSALKRAVRAVRGDGRRDGVHPATTQSKEHAPRYWWRIAPRVDRRRFRNVHECRSCGTLATFRNTDSHDQRARRCDRRDMRHFSKGQSTKKIASLDRA